jgi:cobalt-zinc-cadmium efflux system outer membrane protein
MMNSAQGKRRQRLLVSFVLTTVLSLPLRQNDGANASSLGNETSPGNMRQWETEDPDGMGSQVRLDLGIAPLRIEESWREYKKIPSLFQEMAEEPEGFFSLESPALRDLVKTALRDSPELKEAEAAWKASLEKARVVSALPDPNLAATAFLESVETRVGPQEAVLVFTQKLPWFGKLSAAGQAALEEALEKAWTWRSLQRETVRQVKKTFYDLVYLFEALKITDEDISTLRRYEDIALTRYGTGKGIQQNVVKVQSETTRLNERRIVLLRQRDVARRRLARLVGSPLGRIELDFGDRPLPDVDLRLEDLYGKVRKNREELQARLHAVRSSREGVRLAKKQYWPDFNLGFNYIIVGDRKDPAGLQEAPMDNGKDAIGVLASINLPIWYPKLRAGVDEARLEEYRARAAYARQEDSVLFEVQDAYINLESLREQLDLYRHALIPQAEQSLESSEAAYETGKLTFLELLDSERFLLNVRYGYAKIKSDYLIALADMERALGTRFPEKANEVGTEGTLP